MIIYSFKGCYNNQKAALLEKAWYAYSFGKPLTVIIRDEKGKPFFKDASSYLSISHSKDYWVCVFSHYPVGIDIQYRKFSGNELSIARRFFSNEEAATVEKEGPEAFYKFWARREALGKYLGTGFFIPHRIEYLPIIKEFTIGDGYQGAIATEKEEEIWIKTIN